MEYDPSCAQPLNDRDVVAAVQSTVSMFHFLDGRSVPVSWSFKERYLDEYTQEPLPDAQIQAAIVDELEYVNAEVWGGVDIAEARADKKGKILAGRFVTSNQGDLANPECRARYVACEIHTYDVTAFFAATPPLEAKRILCSQ